MKRIYIPILVCLLLTACQQPSPTGTPDSKATIAVGVTQTLAAQTNETAIAQTVTAKSGGPVSQPTQPPSTPDSRATIAAGVAQTLTAQQTNKTAIAQTLTAMPTGPVSQSTQPPAPATPNAGQMSKNTPTAMVQTLTAMPTGPVSQPTQPRAPATPSAREVSRSTPTPEIPPTSSNSTPQIMFISVPPMGSSEDLFGKVGGVNPEKYAVAVYIRVGGGWWTKPTFAAPTCSIASDGTWNCPYATGGNDTSATVIRAYLIPIGYNPPAMSGGSSLPSVLEKNAVAKVEATR